jgi:hypothetical protein
LRAAARGARRLGLPLLTIVPAALALQAAPALAGSDNTATKTFSAIGCGGDGGVTANEWVVPDGVTSVDVTIRGDVGGGSLGGRGEQLTGTHEVTPGETLYACVGVGGGPAGNGEGSSEDGSAGGGYSALGPSSDMSSPFGIAGGGGGAGGGTNGGGGGDAVMDGVVGNGSPGDEAAGGAGADALGGGVGGVNAVSDSGNGSDGDLRLGGAGGTADVGGGGGGGGVFGGGGGAGGFESSGGGGGGGNSYCDMTSCSGSLSSLGASVTVTYELPPTATTTTLAASDAHPDHTDTVTYTATVSPAPSGGTVAFELGGWDVIGCDNVEVNAGVARCTTNAPISPDAQTLTATYSGNGEFSGSSDELEVSARVGVISVSPAPTFAYGDVELGKPSSHPFTLTNSGDGTLTINDNGIVVAEELPRAGLPRSTDFAAADDECSGRTLAPGASCTLSVVFTPTALGDRSAEIDVFGDAWSGNSPVELTGVGVEPSPQDDGDNGSDQGDPGQGEGERQDPQPSTDPQPQPDPPVTPPSPAPTMTPPPAQQAGAPTLQAAPGASLDSSAHRGAAVTPTGNVRLPLVCPAGQACDVSGTLTLATTAGGARASAAATKTRVLARFHGIHVAAGKTKTLSLRLPKAFVKAQQKKGVRKLRTTLTIHTTLGNGRRVTTRQAVTLLIPRARAAASKPAVRKPAPHFTG